MLSYINNSDTAIIILHEIYGINDHIKTVCEDLAQLEVDVFCPNLLSLDKPFGYEREKEAYEYFTNHIGFNAAFKLVTDFLKQTMSRYKRIILFGYSIGATTGWLCCQSEVKIDGFIGFYGSRIRDYLNAVPENPVLLFFSEEENAFSTKELARKLMNKENIEVHILEGRHGFADPFSKNYNEESSYEAKRLIKDFLTRI